VKKKKNTTKMYAVEFCLTSSKYEHRSAVMGSLNITRNVVGNVC